MELPNIVKKRWNMLGAKVAVRKAVAQGEFFADSTDLTYVVIQMRVAW